MAILSSEPGRVQSRRTPKELPEDGMERNSPARQGGDFWIGFCGGVYDSASGSTAIGGAEIPDRSWGQDATEFFNSIGQPTGRPGC